LSIAISQAVSQAEVQQLTSHITPPGMGCTHHHHLLADAVLSGHGSGSLPNVHFSRTAFSEAAEIEML